MPRFRSAFDAATCTPGAASLNEALAFRGGTGDTPPVDQHERRVAENEDLFRDANERIERRARDAGVDDERVPFLCECYDLNCGEHLLLTLDEYEAARRDPAQFIVAPGHVRPGVERIVGVADHYLVVLKTGGAGEVAAELEPEP